MVRTLTLPMLAVPTLLLLADASAQESKALLHAPVVTREAGQGFQALFDADGDGDLDAVDTVANTNSSVVRVLRNDGGAFTEVWSTTTLAGNASTLPITIADFDGNGLDDFVVGARGAAVRFMAQPGFQFTTDFLVQAVTAAGSRGVTNGDFDSDGLIDVAVAAYDDGTTLGSLDVFLATGTTLTVLLPAEFSSQVRLEALDLDGVGGIDLLYSDRNSGTAYTFVVTGGVLQSSQILVTALNQLSLTPWAWTGGDIDNDGDTDVVCFRPAFGANAIQRYQVFRRSGPSTFVAETTAVGGPAEQLIDVDGDGDLDGVGYGLTGSSTDWAGLSLEIAPNLGGGVFGSAWRTPGTGSGQLAGVADIDADGDLDILASRFIFYGDGAWDRDPTPLAVGRNMTIVYRNWDFGDLDRDGDIDVLPYRINRGDGIMTTYAQQLTAPSGFSFGTAKLCDIDGDGVQDRLMALYAIGSPPQFVQMVWARNNGGNHFYYVGPCAAPGLAVGSVTVNRPDDGRSVDLDGDGDEDRIYNGQTTDGSNPTSQVFWNHGGTFVAGPLFPLFGGGRVDLIADFDQDGLMDLLMSGITTGMHVRRGTGVVNAWFTNVWSAPAMPFEPGAITLGDVNDDGRIDFVRPNTNGELVLFVNTSTGPGNIGFAAHTLVGEELTIVTSFFSAPVRSTAVVNDLDGDGKSDIVMGIIPGEPNVGLVLRRVSWSNPPTLADYEVVRQVLIAGYAHDADSDGADDLIGTVLLRNRRWSAAAAGRRIQQYAGVAGEDGAVPVLGATGPFRVGETEVITLTGVPGPSLAAIAISLGAQVQPNVPLPGLILHVDLATAVIGTLPITENGLGHAAAQASLPLQLINGLQGFTFYMQAFVFDAAAPQAFSQTNMVVKTVGS